MPQCPQCNKTFAELPRRCPTCMADLDLLVDYVQHLHDGLQQAEHFTQSGELAKAVWAYLAVLEVDPDNSTARRQVGQVATAVRQFDRTAPGRRWLQQLRGEEASPNENQARLRWIRLSFWLLLVLVAFTFGFLFGSQIPIGNGTGSSIIKPNDTATGR